MKRRMMSTIVPLNLVLGLALALGSPVGHPLAMGQESPPKDAPPSLDELLGIEGDEDAAEASGADDVAERENREELERRLSGKTMSSAFEEALAAMAIAADQLSERFDTGLGTQRVQEQILARLAHLIDEAHKQQSKGGGGAVNTSAQAPPGDPGPSPPSGSQQSQRADGDASNTQEGDPPPMQQGDLDTVLEEGRTEWGNLPQRERDMLLQGRREKFSSLYRRLTREYYRRLAEEGSP